MERVQTSTNLHFFNFIYSCTVGKVQACLFKFWATIRKFIFNYQILNFFCVYKRSNVSFFRSNNWFQLFNAVICKNLFYFCIWTRCDFIYHCPREADFRFVIHIRKEAWFTNATVFPFFGKFTNSSCDFVAVV